MSLLRSFKSVIAKSFAQNLKHVRQIPCDRLYSSVQSKLNRVRTEEDIQAFKDTRAQFIDEVIQYTKQDDVTIGLDWVKMALEYNLYEKRPYTGLLTVLAFEALADVTQLTSANRESIRFLAWCSKALEVTVIAADDMTDFTSKRYGLPAWHTLPDVKMQAVNDILMFGHVVYPLMVERFGDKEYFPSLIKSYSEGIHQSLLGQTMDYVTSSKKITEQTWEMYNKATYFKTCNFVGFLPIRAALIFCGYKDPKIYTDLGNICFKIGRYWTMRNDFLDSFSDSIDVGTTDINLNKGNWVALKAVEIANDKERQILLDCYGKDDPNKIERVKSLFLEMGIDKLWAKAEDETYNSIMKMIDDLPYDNIKPVLGTFCDDVRELA